MKVKLDLHTHMWEAFNFQPPSLSIAEKIIAQIKSSNIDGIAITDHNNKEWSFELRDLVEQHFPGEVIIIPGWEIEVRPCQNPFDEYQVPLAILTLLQGLGRLIRHRQDRGVLSILDPRILTKGYGRRFLASLPPTPIVREIARLDQFLARKRVYTGPDS